MFNKKLLVVFLAIGCSLHAGKKSHALRRKRFTTSSRSVQKAGLLAVPYKHKPEDNQAKARTYMGEVQQQNNYQENSPGVVTVYAKRGDPTAQEVIVVKAKEAASPKEASKKFLVMPAQDRWDPAYGGDSNGPEADPENFLSMNFLDGIDEYVPGCQEKGTYKEGYTVAVCGALRLKCKCKEAAEAAKNNLSCLVAAFKERSALEEKKPRSNTSRWLKMPLKKKRKFEWSVRN